jgi:hypothetical protein
MCGSDLNGNVEQPDDGADPDDVTGGGIAIHHSRSVSGSRRDEQRNGLTRRGDELRLDAGRQQASVVLENHHADVNVYDTNAERANHGRGLLMAANKNQGERQ